MWGVIVLGKFKGEVKSGVGQNIRWGKIRGGVNPRMG